MKRRFVSVLSILTLTGALHGTPVVTSSASLRVLHDTNLFLQNAGPVTAGQSQAAEPYRQNASAIDAGLALGLGWHFGRDSYELGYAPEIFRYLDHGSENHTDHVLTGTANFQAGGWSSAVTARYLYTDGSKEAPIYNEVGGGPAIGGEPVRARRGQAIAKLAGKTTHDFGAGFVRGMVSVYDQDFHTRERTTYGYCNYADRDESSAGADVGWHASKDLAIVGGARAGYQRQADVLGTPLNFSNTFTRWLAGLEGSPAPTLRLAVLAGPDVRHYGQSVRPGFAREQRTWYGEASASWTPTAADTLSLTGKNYLWVVGSGRGAYVDAIADLTWKHKFAATWSGNLGANFHEGATGRFNPAAPRHDHIYTATAGLSHTLVKHMQVAVDVMHDIGDSLVPNTPGRVYQRWITGFTVARTW